MGRRLVFSESSHREKQSFLRGSSSNEYLIDFDFLIEFEKKAFFRSLGNDNEHLDRHRFLVSRQKSRIYRW